MLDSHIVSSHGANMRVDSFVYTQEGLKDAFDHVKDGGLLSVSFALPNRLMGEKVFTILKALPDAGAPVAILTGYDNNNTTTFMVRKNASVPLPLDFMRGHQLTNITPSYVATSANRLDLPSDDWPFFYLEKKMYPGTYLILFALVLGISFFMVRHFLPSKNWQPPLVSFFFLGAGFMLVETKAITELGLLFGNTWQVVGVTIVDKRAGDGLSGQSGRRRIAAPDSDLGLRRAACGPDGRLHHFGARKYPSRVLGRTPVAGSDSGWTIVFLGHRLFDTVKGCGEHRFGDVL